eukprot:gene15473-19432_t
MAEAVRGLLEQQVDELHDLVAAGIFDTDEVRQIVKRRRAFEYALRRRQTRKIDYLRYIEYELNVEALRKRRKEARNIHRKFKSPSEFAIVKRIHFTFKRALQKFKGDLKLWLQYISFCESTGGTRAQGRAYAEALQFHSLNAGLWAKAASWEWTVNKNVKAARTLLQRGLRLLPQAEMLWKEYLRLELMAVEKIIQRREVLGLPINQASAAEAARMLSKKRKKAAKAAKLAAENLDESSEDSDSDSDDGSGSGSGSGSDDDDDSGPDSDAAGVNLQELPAEKAGRRGGGGGGGAVVLDPFLRGDIPRAVFNAARKETDKATNGVAFALEMVAVFRTFPRTRGLRDDAYAGLGDSAAAIAARCRREVEDRGPDEALDSAEDRAAAFGACAEAFAEALASLASSKMEAKDADGDGEDGMDEEEDEEDEEDEDEGGAGAGADGIPISTVATGTHKIDQVAPEVSLWEQYVQFLQEKSIFVGVSAAGAATATVVEACEAAHKAGAASATVYATWINAVLDEVNSEKGEAYAAALAVATLATAASPDVQLWLRRLALETVVHPGQAADATAAVDAAFTAAFAAVALADQAAVAHARVGYCMAHRPEKAVRDAFVQQLRISDASAWSTEAEAAAAVNKGSIRRGSGSVDARVDPRVDYVEWVCCTSGVAAARELYNQLIVDSPAQLSWPTLRRFVQFELGQPAVKIQFVRMLFERAAPVYGSNVWELWSEWCTAEVASREVENARMVYWRAVKALDNPEPFISAYRLQQLGLGVAGGGGGK